MRLLNSHDLNALKTASRAAVHVCGPVKQITAVSRVSEGRVSTCINRETDDFLPIDVALEIDMMAGAPLIVEAMARKLGYRLVADDSEAKASAFTHRDLCQVQARAAALMSSGDEALDDGRVDAAEQRELHGKIAALRAVLAEFEGKVGGQP